MQVGQQIRLVAAAKDEDFAVDHVGSVPVAHGGRVSAAYRRLPRERVRGRLLDLYLLPRPEDLRDAPDEAAHGAAQPRLARGDAGLGCKMVPI